jgi:chromosome segregation ATPase
MAGHPRMKTKTAEHATQGLRRQLEERRREIADLEQLSAKLRHERDRIDAEQRIAEALPDTPANAVANRALAERRARIEQSLAGIEAEHRRVREGLSEAYYGVRRHEIAAAARAEQQRRRRGI